MAEAKKPVIYLFYGDDEFAISEAVKTLKAKLGDPSTASLNISTMEGLSFSIEEFETASRSAPFLADRRLIIVNNPLAFTQVGSNREKFLALLASVPEHNAVVLVENTPLLTYAQKRSGKEHWLEAWCQSQGERAYIHEFILPGGNQMSSWIMDRASKSGGQFETAAAQHLASMVGDDSRQADQEIIKLLTYVNYERPVEVADVSLLTTVLQEGDIFELVDALGTRQRAAAVRVFHRLLADREPLGIFSMIVRQFRLLILAREILDSGGGESEVSRTLSPKPFNLHPFVARKITHQARQFSMGQLENIYNLLLDMDIDTKSGKMEVDLNVDLMIAEISSH